jgi:hypothetical protein
VDDYQGAGWWSVMSRGGKVPALNFFSAMLLMMLAPFWHVLKPSEASIV